MLGRKDLKIIPQFNRYPERTLVRLCHYLSSERSLKPPGSAGSMRSRVTEHSGVHPMASLWRSHLDWGEVQSLGAAKGTCSEHQQAGTR